MMPQNALEAMGLPDDAREDEIKAAYRLQVKACHPDQFRDPVKQQEGQEKLVRLNQWYQDALKIAHSHQTRFPMLTCEQSKQFAEKMLSQKQYACALRQLSRADSKDAKWHSLLSESLYGLKQVESAAQSARAAVRLEPENMNYRRQALQMEIGVKQYRKPWRRVFRHFRQLFGGRRKNARGLS